MWHVKVLTICNNPGAASPATQIQMCAEWNFQHCGYIAVFDIDHAGSLYSQKKYSENPGMLCVCCEQN